VLERIVDNVKSLPGLYQLRKRRYRRQFFSGNGYWGLWGDFDTYQAALDYVGKPERSTYDHEEIVPVNLAAFKEVSAFDYPVIFWLKKVLNAESCKALVDFGGHVGVKFYAYRGHLNLPKDFKWQVVDVPAMVDAGSAQSESDLLAFYSDITLTTPASILLCSGSLQYSPETIDEVIEKLHCKPEWIVVNKVSVVETRTFFALENFGKSWIPFRIYERRAFEGLISKKGYVKRDEWEISGRRYDVPFTPAGKSMRSIGQVWQRA